MIRLADIQRAWNRFFFESEAPWPIAMYRILLGFAVLLNQLLLLPDAMVWFGQRGALTPETALRLSGGGGLNLLRILPANDGWVWFIFILSIICAVTLMIGFFTRTSAVLLFLTFTTLSHRNVLILMGGDSFLRIAIFFVIFSRAGTALSIDRWLRVKRGAEEGPPPPGAPWAMRLIQLQLAFLYLYAFVWKVMGTMWLNGTAMYYTSRLTEFWRFPVPYVFEHMWTIKLATWTTLVVELALGTLVWIKELRYPVLIAGVLLHAGVEYSMNIPLFGLVMVSAYITFVEPDDLERWLGRGRGKTKPSTPPEPVSLSPSSPQP